MNLKSSIYIYCLFQIFNRISLKIVSDVFVAPEFGTHSGTTNTSDVI
jgi:hypothetical protein